MGQRVSVLDEQRKFVNNPIPVRKEVIEIVYDDTDDIEHGHTKETDQRSMRLEEADSSLLDPIVISSVASQNGTLFKRFATRKSKVFQKLVQMNQPLGQFESTSSVASTLQTKQNICDHPDTILGRDLPRQSFDQKQNDEDGSRQYPSPTRLNTRELQCPSNYIVNENGEITESNSVPSTSVKTIHPDPKQELEAAVGPLKNRAGKLDRSPSPSQSHSLSDKFRSKRKRLWNRVLNQRKFDTSECYVSPDVTLADAASITAPSENVLIHQRLPPFTTTATGETRLLKSESLGRTVTFGQPFDEKSINDSEQHSSSSLPDKNSLPEGTELKSDGVATGQWGSKQNPSDHTNSMDDPCALGLVRSISGFTEKVSIHPFKDWNDDPRFNKGFENELSAIRNQHCTAVTVAAHVPRSHQGKQMKTLTLITLKPDAMAHGDNLSSVCEQRVGSVSLDITIDRHSADVHLVPECLQLVKHSNFVRAKKRFGPLTAETAFVGGNVTGRSKRSAGRLQIKSDRTQLHSPVCSSSIGPASTNRLILTRPVHIYVYRFWICCEPWVEQLFKNPRDRRIESIGRLSDCRIRLTRRRRRDSKGFAQQMVSVVAPNADALEKCCKLFDDKFPCFYATAGLILSHDQLVDLSNPLVSMNLSSRTNTTGCTSSSLSSHSSKIKPKLAVNQYSSFKHGNRANVPVSIGHNFCRKKASNEQFSRFW